TYGKGCSQGLFQLAAVKGGTVVGAIRITMAKFLSPKGEAYSGRGIAPDPFAERHPDPSCQDHHQREEARRDIRELVKDVVPQPPMKDPSPMKMMNAGS